jgi:hypothetical protein
MRKGFTLLEVLVAMVILFTTIVATYQVISQSFGTLLKLSNYQDLYLALTNLIDDIDKVQDFETSAKQTGSVGRFDYEWKASPVSKLRRLTGFEGEALRWEARLYKIDLRVYFGAKADNQKYRDYVIYKTGWIHVSR